MSGTAKLILGDQTTEYETTVGSEGEKAILVKPLRATTKHITLDPGFLNTAACESAITFINGEKGILHYRGYQIADLVENTSFLEVAHLLIEGELPTPDQYEAFRSSITYHTLLHENIKHLFDLVPTDAHPMSILSSAVTTLSTFYQDSLDPADEDQVRLSAHRLMAKFPTIAAFHYKRSRGQAYIYPDNRMDYAANFLKMMFAFPTETYEVDEDVARILDQLFILHADHEQNCSTTAVRVVGSSQANLYASVSAGINALSGPLHGGANQSVLEMLQTIYDDGGDVDKFINLARDKSSGFRLMGFGHRVYKSYDPRALFLQKKAEIVLKKLKVKDPLLDIARRLEEVALSDSYFKDRNLYPNVDFYSGIIYRALNIPVNMFTVMFALGRLPGWITQWKENHSSGYPISRPRQIYTGPTDRKVVPMAQR